MKTAKATSGKVADRRSAEEIQRAFSERAEELTADYVFRPRHVWQVVAINLQTIETLRLRDMGWDDIAEQLRLASGFDGLAGQSVRVYRSRLKKGHYDEELGALGFRRLDDRIVPTDSARGNTGPAEEQPDLTVPQETHRPNPVPAAAPAGDQLRQGARGDIDGQRGSVTGREPERRGQSSSNLSDDDHSDDATPDRLR